MNGDVISHHFLMLWFQNDSLYKVGFRTFGTFFISLFFLGGGLGVLMSKYNRGFWWTNVTFEISKS